MPVRPVPSCAGLCRLIWADWPLAGRADTRRHVPAAGELIPP